MAAVPNYTSKVTVGATTLTTGDTSRTAPTVSGNIFIPDATNALGGMCERITIAPLATTTSSVIRLFLWDGTSSHLFAEVPLAAATLSAGVAVTPIVLSAVDYPSVFPKMVPPTWSLRASVNDTQTGVKIIAEGGSF